jgi:hypothetical protein
MVFECGGAYIRLENGELHLGAPFGIWHKGTFNKREPSQAHLAAPEFSPRLVPFIVSCRAWDRSNDRLPVSHLPRPVRAGSAAAAEPPAPVAFDDAALEVSKKAPSGVSEGPATTAKSTAPSGVSNDDREPTVPLENDAAVPVKMQKPERCEWHLASFTEECKDTSETTTYYALDENKNMYPQTDTNDNRTPSGGVNNSAFELSFDERRKKLTATVRIKIVPVDIFESDHFGNIVPGKGGKPESVPFDHDEHSGLAGNGVDKPLGRLVMKYRDGIGPRFDVAKIKNRIESVLNSHGCKLILNGCSKQEACGCRVSIAFNVEFFISIKNSWTENENKIHKEIKLFPRAKRADAGSWGEIGMDPIYTGDEISGWKDALFDTNAIAHECGHLFNYPDEYWERGGWVHRQYIDENFQLNFGKDKINKGKEVWQMSSRDNVMGGGCNYPVPPDGSVAPSAKVHPYYMEYVRRQFCRLTGETPHYVDSDKKIDVWRRWRIGYDA